MSNRQVDDKLKLMILGVDIGGTKTLLGVFDTMGEVVETLKFPTPKEYDQFLAELKTNFNNLKEKSFETAVVAIPGMLNRGKGTFLRAGNLSWHDVAIVEDLQTAVGITTLEAENDAKLAGLFEAQAFPDSLVLYITISTGIGTAVVSSGRLDHAMLDSEGGFILISDGKQMLPWEKVGSGKAIKEKYGRLARDIDDSAIWDEITDIMALGVLDLCAVVEPDVVIIGGGVGSSFKKFGEMLTKKVAKLKPEIVKMPKIVGAKDAEMASLRGCYVYAQQTAKS